MTTSSTPGASGGSASPTLLLGGADSPAAFHAANAALQEALAGARLAVMPGQRHVAMDTGTELFLAEVLSFLTTPLEVLNS